MAAKSLASDQQQQPQWQKRNYYGAPDIILVDFFFGLQIGWGRAWKTLSFNPFTKWVRAGRTILVGHGNELGNEFHC